MTNRIYLHAEVSHIERPYSLEQKRLLIPETFKARITDELPEGISSEIVILSMGLFCIFLYKEENGGIYTNLRNLPNPEVNPCIGTRIIVAFVGPMSEPGGWGYPESFNRHAREVNKAHSRKEQRRLTEHGNQVASTEATPNERAGN